MESAHSFPEIAPQVNVSYKRPKKFIKVSTAGQAFRVFKKIWDPELINIQEQTYALFLSRSCNLLCWRLLCTGTGNSAPLDRRLLATIALNVKADGVIIAHNHPSGRLKPSRQDIELTKALKSTLNLIDISLNDHVIISDADYYSITTELFIEEYKEEQFSEGSVKAYKKALVKQKKSEKESVQDKSIYLMKELSELQDKYLNLQNNYNALIKKNSLNSLKDAEEDFLSWYDTKEQVYDRLDLMWKQWLSFSIEKKLDNDFIWDGINMFQHFQKYLRSIGEKNKEDIET